MESPKKSGNINDKKAAWKDGKTGGSSSSSSNSLSLLDEDDAQNEKIIGRLNNRMKHTWNLIGNFSN
jgi:hypothetical protein